MSIAFDPRSIGTQIDDSIMQKNLSARILLIDKNYFLLVKTKVIDGRIFITGKVEDPEEKLKITKMAWETKGARSVKSALKIKGDTNFKNTAKYVDFCNPYKQFGANSNYALRWVDDGNKILVTGGYSVKICSATTPYDFKTKQIDAVEGDLIVFPAHCIHRGLPNKKIRKTIVSFNFDVIANTTDGLSALNLNLLK